MQLGERVTDFRERGYGVAAVTYDSADVLRHFAERRRLDYPLLPDPESRIIRAFGILNEEIPRNHEWYGVPYPGMYVIDAGGVVREKFFEEDVRERFTASSVLLRRLGKDSGVSGAVETSHLKLTFRASDQVVLPGNRVTLSLDVELPPGMHLYAPGVPSNYKPISWNMPESKGWRSHAVIYPDARRLRLEAIDETVPVYEGQLRLVRDLTFGQLEDLRPLVKEGGRIEVDGAFRYQACDEKKCYPPHEITVTWIFRGVRHDPERVPADLRR